MEIDKLTKTNSTNTTTSNEIKTRGRTESKIDEHNNCCLCGTPLNFVHRVDLTGLTVREQAHCPACHIHLHARLYTLQ